jgi:hypothetical protein
MLLRGKLPVLRDDLLMIFEFEMELLESVFKIDKSYCIIYP